MPSNISVKIGADSPEAWLIMAKKYCAKCGEMKEEMLVGYTRDELVSHIERQFSGRMAWHNYGKSWHIDHIVPITAFSFTSPDDVEFKACWALTNLRPLLKKQNLQKHAKRVYLI